MPPYNSLEASGAGTKEWLEATKEMTIKAYTENTQPPHSADGEPLTQSEFEDVLKRVSRRMMTPSAPDESSSGT